MHIYRKRLKSSFQVALLLGLFVYSSTSYGNTCADLLSDSHKLKSGIKQSSQLTSQISQSELVDYVSINLMKTPEFEYLRLEAERLGVRVWLFGGTASSFLHYAKWSLAREKGLMKLQKDRFDWDFTNNLSSALHSL